MRRIITLSAGIIGLLLWAYLVTLAASRLQEQPVDYDIQDLEVPDLEELQLPEAGEAAPSAPTTPATAATDAARQVRPIQPDSFGYPAFASTSGLERVEARPALSAATDTKEAVTLLYRPVTLQAGILSFGPQQRIRLKDIAATDTARTCPRAAGGTWPCGEMAKTQQRLFIRNRSVICETKSSSWQGEIISRCWIGTQDLSAWLARQGWAEAEEGSGLAELTQMAKADARGLFADGAP